MEMLLHPERIIDLPITEQFSRIMPERKGVIWMRRDHLLESAYPSSTVAE